MPLLDTLAALHNCLQQRRTREAHLEALLDPVLFLVAQKPPAPPLMATTTYSSGNPAEPIWKPCLTLPVLHFLPM